MHPKLKQISMYLRSDRGLSQIALLPLFFSWYPIILFHYENHFVRRFCLSSLIHTFYFFLFLALGGILSKIPTLGSIAANLSHILGIFIYLSGSIFLIYSVQKGKNMVLPYERRLLVLLESFLIEEERP